LGDFFENNTGFVGDIIFYAPGKTGLFWENVWGLHCGKTCGFWENRWIWQEFSTLSTALLTGQSFSTSHKMEKTGLHNIFLRTFVFSNFWDLNILPRAFFQL